VPYQGRCPPCAPGDYDHDTDAVTPCVMCPENTYQDQQGATSCITCPEARPLSETGSGYCTALPIYAGCFADRESLVDGRDMQGLRHSMGDAKSLEVCAEFCMGYAYMGLQWADQCFCDNTYGAYGQLLEAGKLDTACGVHGDACGQNSTQTGGCAMRNAIFRLPAKWTCADHLRQSPCGLGTAARSDITQVSAVGLTAAGAQAICCDMSCAAWNNAEACAEGTWLTSYAAETPVVTTACTLFSSCM
jgi:hypothetical protein